jgi:hypothetical protein
MKFLPAKMKFHFIVFPFRGCWGVFAIIVKVDLGILGVFGNLYKIPGKRGCVSGFGGYFLKVQSGDRLCTASPEYR